METDSALEAELGALEKLSLSELREVWRARIGRPPKHISAELLRWRLSYQLQANRYEPLNPKTLRQLEKLHAAFTANPEWSPLPRQYLGIGTVLVKVWKGKTQQVTVLEDGFEHQGVRYQSLSQVATAITGTKRSGPAFFGFREMPR